jgi:3-isopropylmalate dehydrogenase
MKIAVMPGDGIGTEVVAQALKVLRIVAPHAETQEAPIGEAGIQAHGVPLPAPTLELARKADAILFGSVGVADEADIPRERRPGTGLLQLREALTLYANFRPAYMFPELIGASTLRPEVVDGLDLVIVRELNGDAYFGQPRGFETNQAGERVGFNTMRYSESEVERVARAAFECARRRSRKVCSVDKANVLEASQLWREVVTRVGPDYPDVELSHLFVDAAAMLTGSIGMLPSASLGYNRKGLYEPVHGSAPDIAGKDIANPLAAILSLAMMLRESFEMEDAARRVERAVRAVLAAGYRTADIHQEGMRSVGTRDMGDAVVEALRKQAA